MKTMFNNLWRNFFSSLFLPEVVYSPRQRLEAKLIKGVEKARQEWKDAYNYFNEVTDPDLIEYATYLIETNRRKYIYLLKKTKELGINM